MSGFATDTTGELASVVWFVRVGWTDGWVCIGCVVAKAIDLVSCFVLRCALINLILRFVWSTPWG
jgi:uncharacterized membrane protein YccF (DUF307 family)